MSSALSLQSETLLSLIDRASGALQSARSSAEVLEARDMARIAYDTAKAASRIARAKQAHDGVMAAVHRAQADALLIEARAKMRLADEYDAAQERGEVATGRDGPGAGVVDDNAKGLDAGVVDRNAKVTAAEVGLRRDEIYDARKLRDAEKAAPGKTERVLTEMIARGEEPTKAKLRREMSAEQQPTVEVATDSDPDTVYFRKALAKLTREALEEDLVGLHQENRDLRKKVNSLEVERDDLKDKIRDYQTDNLGASVGKLQRQCDQMRFARDEALKAAKREEYKRRQAEKRMAELEAIGIPLN